MSKGLKRRYLELKFKLLSEGFTIEIHDAHTTLLAASKLLKYLDESGDLFMKTTMYCVENDIDIDTHDKTVEAFDKVLKSPAVDKIHKQLFNK